MSNARTERFWVRGIRAMFRLPSHPLKGLVARQKTLMTYREKTSIELGTED